MRTVVRPSINGQFPRLPDGIHDVALGNMSQFELAIVRQDGRMLIGIVGKKCYTFTFGPNPNYVGMKLGLDEGDAENMADLIASQFGGEVKPYGSYTTKLCAKA